MQRKAVRFAQAAVLATIPLAVLWATSTPPVGRSGAPGDTTCASCHGGTGGGMSVVVTSTSGMTNYTAGASKHFTVTVSGGSSNAGFEITARPASNLSGGVAGNLVAGSNTQVLCKVGMTCAAGNPQYLRSTAATRTPAIFDFDWTAPAGTEDVTLYLASVVGYSGNSSMATYTLKASGVAPPPTLTVSPAALTFAYQIGGTAAAAQTLTIGGVATTFTAASGSTWLSTTQTANSVSVALNTAGLTAGTYAGSVTITAAGSTGSPKSVPVTLNVTAAAPTLTVSPSALTFAYQIGGTAPAAQTLTIGGVATTFTAAASGGTWLSATQTANSVSVAVNTAAMTAGSYSGSVTIAAAGSTGSPKTVPVTFNVTAAATTLTVSPAALTFAYQVGGTAPAAQTLLVSGVTTTFTAAASGGAWLSVTQTANSVSVAVNTANLAAGTYSGSVTITAAGSTGSPKTVPVTVNVTAAAPTLTVTPAALTFAWQTGGTVPGAQTLLVSGVATTFTAASGGTWLTTTQTANSVSVSVNPTGLAAGSYMGTVTITAAGSTGSPKAVPVTLNVTAPAPTLSVSPAALTFAWQTGGAAPAVQTLSVSGVASTFTAAASGGAWLAAAQTANSVSVSVNTTGMAAGAYSGTVTITAPGSVSGTQVVPVNLTVTTPAPALQITPGTLAFSYDTGNPDPVPYVLNLAGSGTMANYTAASSGGAWLSVSPASGAIPGAVFVSVKAAGLAVGTYKASITITPVNSPGNRQTVPVTLAVTNSGTNQCPATGGR